MLAIEKDIPKPAIHGNTVYPFRAMKKGDSFFVPFERHQPMPRQVQNNIHQAAVYQLKERGLISVRQVEEGGVRGFRVWLTKEPAQ
jgi:hypothetical protein